jgi:hypothetical protein
MLPMNTLEHIARHITDIRGIAEAPPAATLRTQAAGLLQALLSDIQAPTLPAHLLRARGAGVADYQANWEHQIWYHLGELLRIHEGRKERAAAQGGDSWANIPKPAPDLELGSQLKELAKLVALIDHTPPLLDAEAGQVLFEDRLLDRVDAWDIPEHLEVERDPVKGARWKGYKPGGHWFWLKQAIPARPVSFACESNALPEEGGLIIAFCARPRGPDVTFKMTSTLNMSDYYKNYDCYHFSVTRNQSGYSNLRRCGSGLIMLASFADPCPAPGQWHHIEIVKNGPQIDLRADGRLAACYLDFGYIQPVLDGGFFGIRHFGGLNAWHRNVRIAAY